MEEFDIVDNVLIKYNGKGRIVTVPCGVSEIGAKAFCRCEYIQKIELPEGVTRIGESAFYRCQSLSEIILPESLTEIKDYAFFGCFSLLRVYFHKGLAKIGDSAFQCCGSLREITLPKGIAYVGEDAFDTHTRALTAYAPSIGKNAEIKDELLKLAIVKGYIRLLLSAKDISEWEHFMSEQEYLRLKHLLSAGLLPKYPFDGKGIDADTARLYVEFIKENKDEKLFEYKGRTVLELFYLYIIKNDGFQTATEADAVILSGLFKNDAEVTTMLLRCRARLGGTGVLDNLEL